MDSPFQKLIGKTQVYTGSGKGKTTAALGLAFRASGYGLKTSFVRFLKTDNSGELRTDYPLITFSSFGESAMYRQGISDYLVYRKYCSEALAHVYSCLNNDYDIVVCDEILYACLFSLVSEDEILELIKARPESVELVLTGNYMSALIADQADLVTELNAIKHYFDSGLPARQGIEY
jgi:cob(I)alamin adenosyltransferase